ncbi:DUF4276 family protein [Epilithonimonas caeni]|uniref:DUF4276 family protein n=1 Tax=Epilithonimonas caeni TaxID=365343 RepID=UPI00041BBD6B|nr:DUF4276 family protein [Epilithonimonas caeni]
MSIIKTVGIIAEDNSDFDTIKTIINKFTRKKLSYKKNIGNGCGKIKRKCKDYIDDLEKRNCDLVLLFHDLDRNDYKSLYDSLNYKIKGCNINKKFICIPVEEIEAWFLSDVDAIKNTFKIKKQFKIRGNPETIPSPKEFLQDLVYKNSNKTIVFNNVKHNNKIAENLDLNLVSKSCPSFNKLEKFLNNLKF